MIDNGLVLTNDRRYMPTDKVAAECIDGDGLERGNRFISAVYSTAGNSTPLRIS